ncbi:uncharacterized protein LOC130447706 [Diorhabda sublineata]|uniref:uncharacterized protein LOC130447706 n=1 Tax=Diorhabda sublineata TaxID=1163346 RepID=UPI0024E15B12|nr:uncharacterized protein LOC130447706 [Diorhabda sublineata]
MKNLAEVSKEEQLEFINSFDHVLTDIDGVLWTLWVPFPGAAECFDNFRKLGKKINFITNYAAAPLQETYRRLNKNKFTVDINEIINPFMGMVDYLRKIKFEKKIFAIASKAYKQELRKEGFDVAEDPPQEIEESAAYIIQNIQDDEKIGAVIYDFDVNLTFLKLQKALTYLKRKDCLFLIAAGDKKLPVGPDGPLIGNYFYHAALQYVSGRQAVQLAKPSEAFNNFVSERLNITNPTRVLFIGDGINEDMGFATVGGYQKLLVLSGATSIVDVNNWEYPEEYKPKYYISGITQLNDIVKLINKL